MATDLPTLQARLAAAEAAYDTLMTGGQAREIQDQNGERIAYTAANSAALARYIFLLTQQVAAAGGPAAPLGPMRVLI